MNKKLKTPALLIAAVLVPSIASAATLTVNGVALGTFSAQTGLQISGNGDINATLTGFVASGSTTPAPSPTPAATYTIGGTVSGLNGGTVKLLLNGGSELSVSADGAFSFPTQASNYVVTIGAQPTNVTCSVANGSGTATANVTNVSVTCAATPTTPANVTLMTNVSYPMSGLFYSLGPTEIKSFPYTPDANQSSKMISTVQTSSNGTARSVWVSTTPGGQPLSDTNCTKTGISTTSYYGNVANQPSYTCTLAAGTQYYINVQNAFKPLGTQTSCGYSNCGFVLSVNGYGH